MSGKAGGIDRYLLNFLESVQSQDAPEKVSIDFLTDEMHEELKTYLAQRNCELYAIAGLKRPLKQFRQVCAILKNKKYDMVYLNVSTAIDCVAAFAAKWMGVPKRIIHSHSSGNDCESSLQRAVYDAVHKVCRLFFYKAGTQFYGCSTKAGEWIFPKRIVHSDRFQVIYNAVDRSRFQYNPKIRKEVRSELNIENENLFVIGHLGNFCYAKNQPFLIEVFEQIHRQVKGAVLLLGGTGVELKEVQVLVKKKGLEGAVHFLGWRSDTDRLYQAMDFFLLPSRFEGLPVVGVEAQCTKLPCVFSDSVTKETKIQDHSWFLPLSDGPRKWADFILQHRNYSREQVRLTEEAKKYDLERQKEQACRIIYR